MSTVDFLDKAKELVRDYTWEHNDGYPEFNPYVVWSCKTLQNHKALLSTQLKDNMYYEVTYNGDKNEIYFDAYKKQENRCIKLNKEEN